MTLYVIDATRPLPPTTKDYEHALVLNDYDTVVLVAGSEIRAAGYGAFGISGGTHANLVIAGEVHSVQSTAAALQGSIEIRAGGGVYGSEYGVYLGYDYENGRTNIVNNGGEIVGTEAGIYLDGTRNTIVNTGKIDGYYGIYSGGYYDPGEQLLVFNTGDIRGSEHAIVGAFYGPNLVTNKGTIEGNVLLGHGADLYDGRDGRLTGELYLSGGDDVVFGGDGSEAIVTWAGTKFIDGGAGIDTVRCASGAKATIDLNEISKQLVTVSGWATIRNVENLIGSSAGDNFKGNDVANVFTTGNGHDTLEGNGGDDILSGGAHNDLLAGGAGSDIAVYSGRFSDYTFGEDANHALTITDNRANGDGADSLTGIEFALFNDRIVTLSAPRPPATPTQPNPTGPFVPEKPALPTPSVSVIATAQAAQIAAASLDLTGSKRADRLNGGAGDDRLNGGLGKDVLTGNAGEDTFIFSARLGAKNADRVRDFSHQDDQFQLSHKIFGEIDRGILKNSAFIIGRKALAEDDRIVFDEKTGALSYDADGSGTEHAAIKFAQVKAGTILKASDFFIV
ncbi:calcium-binding protein [Microvirga brassicacearum]|uniref:Calcium-binding protein n=1 Tax=Microvirga brassicacearum TaxID=2580413 RepID=A0A5N3P3E8_9HYPH|nr:calcium-binding protein [Microvirga brassicacearum]KAB0264268.1 calcium-binding protein [Microvirga brassicacearum]